MPLLNAIIKVLNEQKAYWPISARQVHYRLLGLNAPLKHASKPKSKYRNDKDSYQKLISTLTRGRTEGEFRGMRSRMKLDLFTSLKLFGIRLNFSDRISKSF